VPSDILQSTFTPVLTIIHNIINVFRRIVVLKVRMLVL
jgi:hypothetical protein